MFESALDARYEGLLATPSDIRAHLPRLRSSASACRQVVEFGVRGGVSTTALLAGRPARLTCYDLAHCACADELARMANTADVRVHRETRKRPLDAHASHGRLPRTV